MVLSEKNGDQDGILPQPKDCCLKKTGFRENADRFGWNNPPWKIPVSA
jgi:hypothetical protein